MPDVIPVATQMIGPVAELHLRNTSGSLSLFEIKKDGVITLRVNDSTGDIEMLGALVGASADSIQESG